MSEHRCRPPRPVEAGDEFICTCRRRYIAVHRCWWSRRLRWEPSLFMPPGGSMTAEWRPRRHHPDQTPRELG